MSTQNLAYYFIQFADQLSATDITLADIDAIADAIEAAN
jgi:hypothetical protein